MLRSVIGIQVFNIEINLNQGILIFFFEIIKCINIEKGINMIREK